MSEPDAMPRPAPSVDMALLPGEYFVGGAQHRVRTLLGSCVAMTLWHPARRIGAMSHFLLPRRDPRKPGALDARYGEDALELMLRELQRLGVAPGECQGKIFGGGVMFPSFEQQGADGIGRKNAEMALNLMRARRIPVVSRSLLGSGHRQIYFYINSGDIWVRQHEAPGEPAPARRWP